MNNQPYDWKTRAKADFDKLKELLTARGILSLTNRADFVSKVWALPIDEPSLSEDGDIIYIDFNYKSISTFLSWEEGEEHPTLSTCIDVWKERDHGFVFLDTIDIEER